MLADPPILLVGPKGEPFGRLRHGVLALVTEAEMRAIQENLAKSSAISAVLKEYIESAGYHVTGTAVQDALPLIQQVRRGDLLLHISVTVQSVNPSAEHGGRTSILDEEHTRFHRIKW